MLKDNYKRAREAKGLTQEALAEKLNVNRSCIGRFENGSLKPSYDLLVASAKVLEVTIDELVAE